MLKIRPISKKDKLVLAQIIRAAFVEFDAPKTGTVYSDPTTDDLFTLFQTKGSVCYVAEENQKVLGCCGIFPTDGLPPNYAELVKFYLSPEARGKGIGKQLFEKCLDQAKQLNYTHLYIESQPSFTKALKLYEAYDFKYIDHSLGNSGHSNCDVWMVKAL